MGMGFGHHSGHILTDREMEQRLGHPLRSVTEMARDKKVFALALTGRSFAELADAFQITEFKVESILDEYKSDPDMLNLYENLHAAAVATRAGLKTKKKRKKVPSKVQDSHILNALLDAMQTTGIGVALTEHEYNEWRAAYSPQAPGTRTIRRRFGWNKAKRLAQGIHIPEGNFENVVDNVA